jgi:hypothetical protein
MTHIVIAPHAPIPVYLESAWGALRPIKVRHAGFERMSGGPFFVM